MTFHCLVQYSEMLESYNTQHQTGFEIRYCNNFSLKKGLGKITSLDTALMHAVLDYIKS